MVFTIYLDVSRLLTAGYRTTPTGIERVEIAYAKEFGSEGETKLVAFFLGKIHFLPKQLTMRFIEALENSWKVGSRINNINTIVKMAFIYMLLLTRSLRALLPRKLRRATAAAIYLNMSHENLVARDAFINFRSRTGAKLLFFVHDLIPITHPEYVKPEQAKLHRRRMDTVGELADAVIVNSIATQDALFFYLKDKRRRPAVHIAHLGVTASSMALLDQSHDTRSDPYFLFLATIEPRKNHLLLLNLWRSLVAHGPSMPRLIIVGRRGWENEMVLDMLERCESLAGIVEERRDVSDGELATLMHGARALLLPSFAEGYGLPVAEALATGTPVICSDLPALREIGGDVPEYIDPLDGIVWRQAILDYAEASSPRRAAQCERLLSWSAPRWATHFCQVRAIIDGLLISECAEGLKAGSPLHAAAFENAVLSDAT